MNTAEQKPKGENDEIPGEEHEDGEEFVQEDDKAPEDDSVEEEARKGELSGPANDLISQPGNPDDED
jgi:hypothetical protein